MRQLQEKVKSETKKRRARASRAKEKEGEAEAVSTLPAVVATEAEEAGAEGDDKVGHLTAIAEKKEEEEKAIREAWEEKRKSALLRTRQ